MPIKFGTDGWRAVIKHAHKISLVWNPENETYYMFYNAVGNQGRGIGLITSKPLFNFDSHEVDR